MAVDAARKRGVRHAEGRSSAQLDAEPLVSPSRSTDSVFCGFSMCLCRSSTEEPPTRTRSLEQALSSNDGLRLGTGRSDSDGSRPLGRVLRTKDVRRSMFPYERTYVLRNREERSDAPT